MQLSCRGSRMPAQALTSSVHCLVLLSYDLRVFLKPGRELDYTSKIAIDKTGKCIWSASVFKYTTP